MRRILTLDSFDYMVTTIKGIRCIAWVFTLLVTDDVTCQAARFDATFFLFVSLIRRAVRFLAYRGFVLTSVNGEINLSEK